MRIININYMKKYFIAIFLSLFIVTNSAYAIGALDSFKDTRGVENSTKTISLSAGVDTTKTIPEIIGLIIKIIIGLAGTICLIIIVSAGINIMIANGDKNKILEARKKMVPTIIGLALLAAAYSLTDFILKQLISVA